MTNTLPKGLQYDEVGAWSELKLEILKKYASAYTRILLTKNLHPIYIEGFAGAGLHISKKTKELIPGSPLNALNIDPPFEEFHLVDLSRDRVDNLKSLTRDKRNVHIYNADANAVLQSDIFPKIRYSDYRRALCVLDPYKLNLNWTVIQAAAQLQTIEIFLNFPVMDMNRNILLWRPESAARENIARMNAFWGDDSWREIAYRKERTLFGEQEEKQPNEVIAEAFRERLKNIGMFKYVPEPAPMRNSVGAVVYYLFFAAQQQTASKVLTEILDKYRKEGRLHG